MTYGPHPEQVKVLPEGHPAEGDDIVFGLPGVPGPAVAAPKDALCGFPVGNGTCVLAPGHTGNHRLTAPNGSETAAA